MNWSAGDVTEAMPGVTTVTSTVPVPAGLVAVIWVSESTTTFVAATMPKSTCVAPLKPDPVIVTVVPPVAGPEGGLTPVTLTSGQACT